MGKTYQMKISGSGIADNGIDQIHEMQNLIKRLGEEDEDGEMPELDDIPRRDLVTFAEDLRELELGTAESAISCLHDALLAVAKGMLTPAQVKDFFWAHDLDKSTFIGGVLKFTEKEPERVPEHPIQAAQHDKVTA